MVLQSCWREEQFPGFTQSMDRLYQRSLSSYYQTLSNSSMICQEELSNDMNMLKTFFQDLEIHYILLMKLGMVTNVNCKNILEQLKSIDLVKILPKQHRKYYGLTYDGQISINPDIQGKYNLSSDFLKQMSISHELGHIVNASWMEDAKAFSSELYQDPRVQAILKNMGLNDKKYLQYGFSLIDEVVAQEAAERVSYQKEGLQRPKREARRDKAIFNHNPYITNYVFYGELQDFAISFARSLSYMDCAQDREEDVLLKLVRRSFDKDFIQKIRKEVLSNPSKLDDFIIMLACMGRVKDATYQVLGLHESNKSLNVNSYVDPFQKVAKRSKVL